jgi:hypothetical protein
MSETPGTATEIDFRNLREFFRDSLHQALRNQDVEVEEHTEHYVVNLLTMFARSEALFERTSEGVQLRPLALMLADAVEASSADQRERVLQRLGDVSLFTAGFFAQGFARRLVDVDYHIAMGGRLRNAGQLGAEERQGPRACRRIHGAGREVPAVRRCAERSERDVLPSQ